LHTVGTLYKINHMKKLLVALLMMHMFYNSYTQTIISDLHPGMEGSNPTFDNAAQLGNEIYFTAIEAGLGSCLYKTDGESIVRLEGNPSAINYHVILGVIGDELVYYQRDVNNLQSRSIR